MAKIPLIKTNFRTLTQVFPRMLQDSKGQPETDSGGNLVCQAMNRKTDLFIDVNMIAGCSRFYDIRCDAIRSGYTQITIMGVSTPSFPIVVDESYATIKGYMNQRDNCGELCTE